MPRKRPVHPASVLRAFVSQHPTAKNAALMLGVSAPYLSDMLKGKRDVGPKVLAKLGLTKTVVYAVKAS